MNRWIDHASGSCPGYPDLLSVFAGAIPGTIRLTDSGGVQEEACIPGVPCVTLRENTERPETVQVRANVLVGTNPDDICQGAVMMMDAEPAWDQPFGDGHAAEKICRSARAWDITIPWNGSGVTKRMKNSRKSIPGKIPSGPYSRYLFIGTTGADASSSRYLFIGSTGSYSSSR